ncbi:MAG: pantothenate kinase [Candidatus Bathyarchaeia archaeon]
MIIGMDIGATATKAVAMEGCEIAGMETVRTADTEASAHLVLAKILGVIGRDSSGVGQIAISGGGARRIGEAFLNLPVVPVDEMRAIGLGGLALSGKEQALIVSMGTGTALVVAFEGGKVVKHIGGTGVGGGTIKGLSRWMLGRDQFEVLEKMAEKGNASKVDLTVTDIAGGPVGIVPAKATASNFGKLKTDACRDDVAAAIFNMAAEVIGVVTAMAAKAYNLEKDVVLVGKLIQSRKIAEVIRQVAELFQMRLCIPENGEYCVAIGAAKAICQSVKT